MSTTHSAASLAADMLTLHTRVKGSGEDRLDALSRVHPRHRPSAENLLDYLALRSTDLRALQRDLARCGLSSLGRCEAHVDATLQATCRAAAALAGVPTPDFAAPPVDFDSGPARLDAAAEALFGPGTSGRSTRVMVTLPSEAAGRPDLIASYVAAGASVFRINTAHDGPDAWAAMATTIRDLQRSSGQRLTVAMDLAGPKLRTGPIAPGPRVVRFRPDRDLLGRPVRPATVVLVPDVTPAETAPGTLPVTDSGWLARRREGEAVGFVDTRGSRRTMIVTGIASDDADDPAVTCRLTDTAYLIPGMALEVGADRTTVGRLAPVDQRLRIVDRVRLVADLTPVDPGQDPPIIGCTLPEVFRDTAIGDRVSLDDGRIAGRVVARSATHLDVAITHPRPGGVRLAAEKGINLPDTELDLPALTETDRAILPFVVEHADLVDFSFVRTARDVDDLRAELARLGRPDLPFLVKLETMTSFRHLPEILLAAMASPHVGVMIARGDLAVEAGYVRMGEIQEEILWICEAAHVPVAWATQVLEDLAKRGRPARAEVTDAATAARAECVMLNKGPYIPVAIRFLDQLLPRMQEHLDKKAHRLRKLHLSQRGSDL